MQRSRLRLIVATLLFVGWLGWLAYLAATGTHPTVLSRPQFMVAEAVIVARVSGDEKPNASVTIQEVKRGPKEGPKLEQGAEITITGLDAVGPDQGWSGPGDYLLALSVDADGYILTPIPDSPGYSPEEMKRPIYPVSPEVLRRYAEIAGDRQ